MGALSTFILLAAMGGAGMSPGLVNLIVTQRRENHEKWAVLLNEIVELITSAYFYLRGPQEFVDSAGKESFSNEAIKSQVVANQKDFLQQHVIGRLLGGITRSILALIKPSAAEEALMMALVGRGGMGGGMFGGPTNVINQPAARGRSAGEVLKTGPRAQAVMVNADGSLVAY